MTMVYFVWWFVHVYKKVSLDDDNGILCMMTYTEILGSLTMFDNREIRYCNLILFLWISKYFDNIDNLYENYD